MDPESIRKVLELVKSGVITSEQATEILTGEGSSKEETGKATESEKKTKPNTRGSKSTKKEAAGKAKKTTEGDSGETEKDTAARKARKAQQAQEDNSQPTEESAKEDSQDKESQEKAKDSNSEDFTGTKEWKDFVENMEQMGQSFSKGFEDLGKRFGFVAPRIENPFGMKKEVLFRYSKKLDGTKVPKWKVKVPMDFLMHFKTFILSNPHFFGNPSPIDFAGIFRQLEEGAEGTLWEMEDLENGDYWEVILLMV